MNDRVSGQTTGPILMPFCIRTTYWSPTCLHVFFFKNLKKWQPCTHICIFCILPDNSKTTQPDLTRFHIQFLGRISEFSIVSVFSKYGNTAQKADSKNRNFTKSRRARFFLFVCAEGAQQMLQAPQAPCAWGSHDVYGVPKKNTVAKRLF